MADDKISMRKNQVLVYPGLAVHVRWKVSQEGCIKRSTDGSCPNRRERFDNYAE